VLVDAFLFPFLFLVLSICCLCGGLFVSFVCMYVGCFFPTLLAPGDDGLLCVSNLFWSCRLPSANRGFEGFEGFFVVGNRGAVIMRSGDRWLFRNVCKKVFDVAC